MNINTIYNMQYIILIEINILVRAIALTYILILLSPEITNKLVMQIHTKISIFNIYHRIISARNFE